jgi:WD40 repeat protein
LYDPRFPNRLASPAAAAAGGGQEAGSYVSRGYAVQYSGHRNNQANRNASWMGSRSQYVLSGSDDGCMYVWDAASGRVINVVRGGPKSLRRVQVREKGGGVVGSGSGQGCAGVCWLKCG